MSKSLRRTILTVGNPFLLTVPSCDHQRFLASLFLIFLFTTDLWLVSWATERLFTSGPSCSCTCTPSSGRDSSFLRLLRTWRAVGRGIFPLFHLTIVLASLLVHVWMAARSVTVTGTTSRPLPTSSSTCRTGGTLSRIPRAGVLYWDDIDNGTLSIEFSMLLFCPPATSRAAPEIFMCHY